MKKILHYVSPLAHLGEIKYSVLFPLLGTIIPFVILEIVAYFLFENPESIGMYAIFVSIVLIIYYAFRCGLRGGYIATGITLCYYLYIIHTRGYTGQELITGIETTFALGVLYSILAGIIGWLKQTIDVYIDREAHEKRRLQTIIQQLPVGVVITDSEGNVIQGNKQLETILGRRIRDGVVAGKYTITSARRNGKPVLPNQWPLAQALATGKSVGGKEITLTRADGKEVVIMVSATPILNKEGKVMAAASILRDITEEKEAETRKDDFVNMASHELKTPLTSMKVYLDLLAKNLEGKDEKSTMLVQNIQKQSGRLHRLVNDLLDVSRLQTGKLTVSKEVFRLDTLLKDTITTLQQTTPTHTIVCKKIVPLTVFGDTLRIEQVITNLITNAIKYSPEGTTINVKAIKDTKNAIVSVQDFGVGISTNEQKKIFARLYQVSDGEKNTYPGFGMGLYIAEQIIKKHTGSIWVISELQKGSTFYVSLPLHKK